MTITSNIKSSIVVVVPILFLLLNSFDVLLDHIHYIRLGEEVFFIQLPDRVLLRNHIEVDFSIPFVYLFLFLFQDIWLSSNCVFRCSIQHLISWSQGFHFFGLSIFCLMTCVASLMSCSHCHWNSAIFCQICFVIISYQFLFDFLRLGSFFVFLSDVFQQERVARFRQINAFFIVEISSCGKFNF